MGVIHHLSVWCRQELQHIISVGTGMTLCVTGGCLAVGTMPISPGGDSWHCPVMGTSFCSWEGLTAILTFSWNQWETQHSWFCTKWSYFLHSSNKLLQINKSVMAHEEWAPSQLWGKAAMLAEVWVQHWVGAWSPILCLTLEHTGTDLPCLPLHTGTGDVSQSSLSCA